MKHSYIPFIIIAGIALFSCARVSEIEQPTEAQKGTYTYTISASSQGTKTSYDADGTFNPRCRLGCMGCPQKSDRGLGDFKANPRLVRFWLRNGEIWWNTHKLKKTKKKFKSYYEVFVRNIFFDDYDSFHDAIDNMFCKIDCKKFLEDYFHISLDFEQH